MIEVNSLWIGNRLSSLEQMCLKSHLINGHVFNLWCYNTIDNTPKGVIIRDAREILPESEIFAYFTGEGKGSYSAFSNFFRYKLLLDRGGWWVDMDVCCLKQFSIDKDRVFASEKDKNGGLTVTTCVIKSPPKDEIIKRCWEVCKNMDKKRVVWGEIGPVLLNKSVKESGRNEEVVSFDCFCPINWYDTDQFFSDITIPDSYAVHMWNEMWRRSVKNKDIYQSNTLYGRLMDRFLPRLRFV